MTENPNANVNQVPATDIPTTTTIEGEGPNCLCCEPPQPLEPPDTGNYWICPATGKKYTYDLAVGGVPVLVTPRQQSQQEDQQQQTTEVVDDEYENVPDRTPVDDQRPQRRQGRRRSVDPSKDPFA